MTGVGMLAFALLATEFLCVVGALCAFGWSIVREPTSDRACAIAVGLGAFAGVCLLMFAGLSIVSIFFDLPLFARP